MTREQTTIRLPTELLDSLRREAEGRGKSFNSLVVNVLWSWFRAFQS